MHDSKEKAYDTGNETYREEHIFMKMSEKERNAPSRAEIMQLIRQNWEPERGEEYVSLEEAGGRIASRDVFSVHTIPVVRASAMDGIAVRSADFADDVMPDTENWQYGVDYIRADTGDDFADDFDAVIAIEDVRMLERGLRLSCSPSAVQSGANVRPCGSTVKEGELLIPKGYEITPLRMAALATGGIAKVWVYKKPIVAFIPTGSELIPAGQALKRGQNIDANSLLIRELARQWGADVKLMPIVKDQMKEMKQALTEALKEADLVLINGGSSKGSEDYSIPLLEKEGTVLQHYVRSAPGRPMSVSLVRGKLVLNIPGPTFATMAVSDWAVQPAIDFYYERKDRIERVIQAQLESDLKCPPFMEIYTRVIVRRQDGIFYAAPLRRDARMEDGFGRCNGILVTELGRNGYQKGETVSVKLI